MQSDAAFQDDAFAGLYRLPPKLTRHEVRQYSQGLLMPRHQAFYT